MPKPPYKRISVIGLGYIGLPTAAMFVSRKIELVGIYQTADNKRRVFILLEILSKSMSMHIDAGLLSKAG